MDFGIDARLLSALQDMLDYADDHHEKKPTSADNNPTRAYVRDAKAMAATPADVKEYPNSYAFVVDMPGIKPNEIQVQVEDENRVLVVSGERKRDKEEKDSGVKYLRMERRVGKFMRKFVLPENANMNAVSAVCKDGVLQVTIEKFPPPQPKKPKTIQVNYISLPPRQN